MAKAKKAPKSKGKSRSYHHGNLRDALVEGALATIREKGVQHLTLREAARRAGVSQAAPYRHFDSKEALIAAVAEDGFRSFAKEMEESTQKAMDPKTRLQELGVAYVRFATKHPDQFRVMFGPDVPDKTKYSPLAEASQASFSPLVLAIQECQRAGVVRKGDPLELAVSAWSLVHGLASLLVDARIEGHQHPGAGPRTEMLTRRVAMDLFDGLAKR